MRNQYKILAEKYIVVHETTASTDSTAYELIDIFISEDFKTFYTKARNFIKTHIKYRNFHNLIIPVGKKPYVIEGSTQLQAHLKNFRRVMEKYPLDYNIMHAFVGSTVSAFGHCYDMMCRIEECVTLENQIAYETQIKPKTPADIKFQRKTIMELRGALDDEKVFAKGTWGHFFYISPAKKYKKDDFVVTHLIPFKEKLKEILLTHAAQTQHTSTHGVDLSDI